MIKTNKWQRPTCDNMFGMSRIIKREVLERGRYNIWVSHLLSHRNLNIKDVVIHSYKEQGTALWVTLELHTDCQFKPIRMGNILL